MSNKHTQQKPRSQRYEMGRYTLEDILVFIGAAIVIILFFALASQCGGGGYIEWEPRHRF